MAVTRLSDGCLLDVNEAWLRLTHRRRDEVIGRTTLELGHWPDEAARQAFLARVPRSDDRQRLTVRPGEPRWVRMHTSLVGEDRLLTVITDSTAEHETGDALQRANVALEQRVELHGAIEELAQVGHWTNAPSEQAVIWSPGLYAITGLEAGPQILRKDGRSGIHPDDLPAWLAAREACDGRVVEFRWQRPDGSLRWMRTRISRTLVAGNPQTDFGIVQDITAEREAREALSRQLELFQALAARMPGLIYVAVLTPQGRSEIRYVNDKVEEMLELTAEELRADARLLFERVHPDDRPAVRESLAISARDLTVWRQIYRAVLPAKGVRWYQVEGAPQREPDGSVVWHGFTADVTERLRAEQRLQRQHRLLEAVRRAQAVFIEADDKRRAFGDLLAAFVDLTGSEHGFIGEVLYDEQGQPYLRTHAMSDVAWDATSRSLFDQHREAVLDFRNLDTLFGHALRSGEVVFSAGPDADTRAGGTPDGHPILRRFLGIPIGGSDRLVAMVGLANAAEPYSPADVEFLQPLLGAVRQMVLAWRGHAERRRTREALQATTTLLENKTRALQATLDSMSQGLLQVDALGRVAGYNQRLLELLALPAGLMASRPTYEAVLRFQLERADFGPDAVWVQPEARPYTQLDQTGAPDHYWRRTRDGRTLEVHTFHLDGGGFVRTFSDVTSYIQTQEALRAERQRLAWILEATRPGVWETNLTERTLTVDERWAEIVGYTLDELRPVGRHTWERLVHPDDLRRATAIRDRHVAGELPYYECDVRMRHKAGHWVWVNSRGRVHQRDDEDRAVYMSGTHLDISDRVAAQEQIRALNANLEQRVRERTAELERSMRDMEAISYSIAHDLRAPLRSVNGFAAIVQEEEAERLSPVGQDMFGRIERASRHMGQMLTDMLELLRVVRVALEPVPVDMDAVTRAALEPLGALTAQAQVELHPLPPALGDAALLRQVMGNLLDNALKYARPDAAPRVWVGFDEAADAYYVRDDGVGFDMAHAGKLFGLFQRLHAGSTVPGMGVGLAIVARIIERHSGRIWPESAPQAGATFWFRLPRP